MHRETPQLVYLHTPQQRVDAQVFVGNSVEQPLSYKGHLDAGGIAAHLSMLQRVECVVRGKVLTPAQTRK